MLWAQLGPVQESLCWDKLGCVIACICWIFQDEGWNFCPSEVSRSFEINFNEVVCSYRFSVSKVLGIQGPHPIPLIQRWNIQAHMRQKRQVLASQKIIFSNQNLLNTYLGLGHLLVWKVKFSLSRLPHRSISLLDGPAKDQDTGVFRMARLGLNTQGA